MKYYYADREDSVNYSGPYNSIKEAREQAEDMGLTTYYIGEEDLYSIQPNGASILDWIAEDLDEEAYEEAGVMWWNEIKNRDELGDEIDTLIRDFLDKKVISTTVVRIINSKEYVKGIK